MRLSYLFIAVEVISLVYRVGFVFLPGQLLSLYGINTDRGGVLMAGLFGAALISYGVVTWLVRNAASSDSQRAIMFGLFVFSIVSFVVLLLAQLAGTVNALGWLNVIIFL